MRIVSLHVALFLACIAAATAGAEASAPDATVWSEFTDLLRSQPLPAERVRPYQEELREPVLEFLGMMREQADWGEFSQEPDVFLVGDRTHYVLPLTFGGETASYCFSFITEDGKWYFQHLEGIYLRLDEIGPLPASDFPDLPDGTKAWMRAELEVSRDVWLYNALAAEKGREAALDWFRDGAGYALAARSWVPFVSPERAFVLYLCWEQSSLRGNEVVLEALTDAEALVRLTPIYLLLYEKTGHLKQQITQDEYVGLFEFRWRDRAASAGWGIEFSYDGPECLMRLHRAPTLDEAAPASD